MTVFAGIFDLSGQALDSSIRSAATLAFTASCQHNINEQLLDQNCLLLSYHINETLPNQLQQNEYSTSLIVGDPILRTSPGELTQETAALNSTENETSLFTLLTQAKGVFAGVKYDNKNKIFSLFTDKSGIRPVFYIQIDNLLIFSSLSSFFAHLDFLTLETEFDNFCQSIAFGFCLSNKTIYKNLYRLDSGQCLTTQGNQYKINTYWDWQSVKIKKSVSQQDIADAYQSFEQAVKLRLSQNQQAIAFLSGGLDSRVICSQVNQQVKELHTFNFSTERSQDNEFARLYAEQDELIHHEKQFATLSFPNWAQLIANTIEEKSDLFLASTNRHTVWSGDGGSVGVGSVYISQAINDALIKGNTSDAIAKYLTATRISIPVRFLKSSLHNQTKDLIAASIAKEFISNDDDPAKSIYYFLMNNDQKRHLENHFETICQHQIELCLPFFDSDFLEKIYAIPSTELLNHKFYMKWFEHFPANTKVTPWQTYPGHEKCPLAVPAGLSYQWDNPVKPINTNKTDFKVYLDARKSPVFKKYFSSSQVILAMLLHRFGLKDFSYLVKTLKQISRFK